MQCKWKRKTKTEAFNSSVLPRVLILDGMHPFNSLPLSLRHEFPSKRFRMVLSAAHSRLDHKIPAVYLSRL